MRGMALPRRKPNRLPNYDYSQAGYYFITLCTKDKQPLFWQPSVGADIIRPRYLVHQRRAANMYSAIR